MGIYKISKDLQVRAINSKMVGQASVGDIQIYNNSSISKYPFVNFDVISSEILGYAKEYNFRIYVCDRNSPYVAYNKTEIILDNILKGIEVEAYTVNYFTLDFKDLVNGVWSDFKIQVPLQTDCITDEGYILDETALNYIEDEDGNLIKQEKYDK